MDNKRMSDACRRLPGFTLIELLLVLVILAVLAAVVVPKFTKRSEQARVAAAKTDISNLDTAFDAFEVDTGRYPTVKRLVLNDPWGNPYVYRCPGQHNTSGYDLYSFGPDGQEGGGDDIDNWSQR
jgi:general secretion pathway protein G